MSAVASNSRKTPSDASEFEREQLRFFLTRDDLSATLAELNPSVAWLPWLAEVKLFQHSAQLAHWIEKNFDDAEALRDVVANLQYLTPKLQSFLSRA